MSMAGSIPNLFKGMLCSTLLIVIAACASAGPTTASTPTDAAIEPTPTPMLRATTPPGGERASPSPVIESPTLTPADTTEDAGNADVIFVSAVLESNGTWIFHVTVEHPDTGWEDYANGWDVLTPAGEVLRPDRSSQFTRLLLHPHENEQPFTRSQSGIVIPEDVTQVRARAHDIVDDFRGQ